MSLEHTSAGGGLGGGGAGGRGRGGGEYFTHQAHDVTCAPLTVFFVGWSQHSPDDSNGLSGWSSPPSSLPHAQPFT